MLLSQPNISKLTQFSIPFKEVNLLLSQNNISKLTEFSKLSNDVNWLFSLYNFFKLTQVTKPSKEVVIKKKKFTYSTYQTAIQSILLDWG